MNKELKIRGLVCCCLGALSSLLLPAQLLAEPKLRVYAVNYPLKYFAERIGAEHVEVLYPVPDDIDPAFWKPDREAIASLQKADLILLNGASYEKWRGTVSLPRSRLVDTSAGFKDRYIKIPAAVRHSHGPDGAHSHEGTAFTTWLDLELAAEQAQAVAAAFAKRQPARQAAFAANAAALKKDLLALDAELTKIAARNPAQPLIASHPVYQYFKRRYKLNIESIHWEPDEVPSAEQLQAFERLRSKHPAKWLIWEGWPHAESVAKLQEMGVGSLVFAPCGNRPEQGDFLSVMTKNVRELARVFQ